MSVRFEQVKQDREIASRMPVFQPCKSMTIGKFGVLAAVALPLLLLALSPAVHVYANPVSAKVVHVDHLGRVLPDKYFTVTIIVEYSERFLADVGIWDLRAGEIADSLTLISSFTGPGRANFSFELTAPSTEGEWYLLAMTRVWWQDGWFQDPNGGSMPFTITISNEFILTLSSQRDTRVMLDGSEYQVHGSTSLSLRVQGGTHSLEASRIVQASPGKRFVFVGWSDRVNSNSRSILITNDTSIEALYRTDYYLSVRSEMGEVSGEGWYEEGSCASFGVTPAHDVTSWSGLVTEEYRFSIWSGNSGSTDEVASIVMDGPKSVRAEWVHSARRVDLDAFAGLFFLGSVGLAVRIVYRYSKGGSRSARALPKFAKRLVTSLFLTLSLVLSSNIALTVQAQLPFQPSAENVEIGDAYWYYWNTANSDTCLLWLGGGISQESVIGYNYYWINPFDYESFGTIHFIQDLTKYYCVLALQRGSYRAFNAAANRTIYQELYQIQAPFIAQIHDWIRDQGYQHTFLVGYSVGGQAAAMEVTLRAPQDWTSRDGLVLITVPLARNVIDHAHQVGTSLLFLYGGNLPEFVATGQQFFENAPPEGMHESGYYHKEFYVLGDVGHEVWTVRETGAYTTRAVKLVVSFIEKSKALQLDQISSKIGEFSQNTSQAGEVAVLTSIRAPRRIGLNEVYMIEADVTSKATKPVLVTFAAYDAEAHRVVRTMALSLMPHDNRTIRLVMPPVSNATELKLSLMLLDKVGGEWVLLAQPNRVEIIATNFVTLTIDTYVPGLTIVVDGLPHRTDATGRVKIETTRGTYVIQLQPVLYVDNVTRFVFASWENAAVTPTRTVDVGNDTKLIALYRKQYFVAASSPYGDVQGSEWHDANSTARVLVQPSMITPQGMIFVQWSGDSREGSPQTLVIVDSPKELRAVWKPIESEVQQSMTYKGVWFLFSLLTFFALLILNLRSGKRGDARGGSALSDPGIKRDHSCLTNCEF